MGKYIKYYDTHSEYDGEKDLFDLPNVSWCEQEEDVHYNEEIDYSKEYLTFVAKADGTFKFSGSTTANTLSYSLDNGNTWTELANNTDSPTVTSGNKILWKGTCTPQSNKGIGIFSSTSQFDVEGNAMSLLFGDDFKEQTSLGGKNYALTYLFRENNIVSAENLSLPATTLANYCYHYMFFDCTNLTKAPSVLPATTLTIQCYYRMFFGCTSLTIAPELPATTLATNCYASMFQGCTSLTTAPSLPATTLAKNCYGYMFYACTNLTTAPTLPATTLVSSCYGYIFAGCTSLNSVTCLATDISATSCTDSWLNSVASSGTFTKAASMTSWTTGVNGIPSGWTVQTASA